MQYTTRINWETLRILDSSTLAGAYVKLGTPLANPSFILKLVNNSNILVTISIDGATDIDVAPAGSFWLYDESKIGPPGSVFVPQGTQFYVKSGTGGAGAGNIYLVTQYVVQQ